MNEQLPYAVIRSKRKTLSITVNRKGEIVLRAPLKMSEKEIAAFFLRHAAWANERALRAKAAPVLSLENGAAVTLFGEQVTIRTGKARLTEDTLFLPDEGRKEALVSLLKREAYGKILKIAEEFAKRYSFANPAVHISAARSRWGSCNRKGTLSFSCFLSFVPHEAAEYVVVHELCHTREFNHSARFWREVERILPDYRARKQLLKRYHWVLNG